MPVSPWSSLQLQWEQKEEAAGLGRRKMWGEHMYTWVLSGAASSLAESALGLAELCAPWDQLEVILHAFL